MATAMLTLAGAVSLPVLMFGLCEAGAAASARTATDINRRRMVFSPKKCPQRGNAVTGDGGSGSLIPSPWPMVAR